MTCAEAVMITLLEEQLHIYIFMFPSEGSLNLVPCLFMKRDSSVSEVTF